MKTLSLTYGSVLFVGMNMRPHVKCIDTRVVDSPAVIAMAEYSAALLKGFLLEEKSVAVRDDV